MKFSQGLLVTSVFAATVSLAASQDGVWTGHDWTDSVDGIQNVDGDLVALEAFIA